MGRKREERDLLTSKEDLITEMSAMTEPFRKTFCSLTEERIMEILDRLEVKRSDNNIAMGLKLPKSICVQYFSDMGAREKAVFGGKLVKER